MEERKKLERLRDSLLFDCFDVVSGFFDQLAKARTLEELKENSVFNTKTFNRRYVSLAKTLRKLRSL